MPINKSGTDFMSNETYEVLDSRFELYNQIKKGMDDIALGNTRPFSEAMDDIRRIRRWLIIFVLKILVDNWAWMVKLTGANQQEERSGNVGG